MKSKPDPKPDPAALEFKLYRQTLRGSPFIIISGPDNSDPFTRDTIDIYWREKIIMTLERRNKKNHHE